MKLLVDTHAILWWLTGAAELSPLVRDYLDHEPEVYLSPVSVWEVAIKQATGKLVGPDDLPQLVAECGLRELPVTSRHALRAGALPPHHRDPFDRMLIAQADCEQLTLVSRDNAISRYEVSILRP